MLSVKLSLIICGLVICLLAISIIVIGNIEAYNELQQVKINDIRKIAEIKYENETVYYCGYIDDNSDLGVLKVRSDDEIINESGNDITWGGLLGNSKEMITLTKPLNIRGRKENTPDIIQEEITAEYGEKGIGAICDTCLDVAYSKIADDSNIISSVIFWTIEILFILLLLSWPILWPIFNKKSKMVMMKIMCETKPLAAKPLGK